mmetsp:Transcript_4523/g.9624  ORF Transcript_4523/g.9624 Transcript_4523/m.9624 type:complete len:89 (-) Transcript_4523:398-664(-)
MQKHPINTKKKKTLQSGTVCQSKVDWCVRDTIFLELSIHVNHHRFDIFLLSAGTTEREIHLFEKSTFCSAIEAHVSASLRISCSPHHL